MLLLQNISYLHPGKELLFENLNLSMGQYEKLALVGNNGSGKSTLLRLISGELHPSGGNIQNDTKPFYIPQVFGQYNHFTIAEALGVANKLNALKKIIGGDVSQKNLDTVQEDWTVEERCKEALSEWQLNNLDVNKKMDELSGGQKAKVFLAGISIHRAEFVLMDEPSNHLDIAGRKLLYQFIESTNASVILVSHDRTLLNLVNKVCELRKDGIAVYGGNYNFYSAQKQTESEALEQDVQNKEKALRKAKQKERDTMERQQKLDTRGKAKQEKAGVARIMMNTLRNKAENSTAKTKDIHAGKIIGIKKELQELRKSQTAIDQMKFGFDNSSLHKGKVLFIATNVNISYNTEPVLKQVACFQINSGERIAFKGPNGSGKTSLIKLLFGQVKPHTGTFYAAESKAVYIDQDYSLINGKMKVYEQAEQFNACHMQEHEIKIRLHRFLFGKEDWEKSCNALSGGERMRLLLCCLTIAHKAPDIIILDEPTNNLDIQNIEILASIIKDYQGTLIIVSHDETFLQEMNIDRSIELS